MTNLVAAVMVLLATNWTEVGTLNLKDGQSFRVEEGRRMTNTIAVLEFDGQMHTFTLKSTEGQVVGEHRVPIFPTWVTNIVWPGFTNWFKTNNASW